MPIIKGRTMSALARIKLLASADRNRPYSKILLVSATIFFTASSFNPPAGSA